MRRFSFRLQRALDFALLRENQKKKVVARALQRISFLKKYTVQLETKIRTAIETSNRAIGTLEADAHRQSVLPTIEESRRIQGLLGEEEKELHTQQEALVRLSQRRRSLESLREKRMDDFKLDRSRAEQKRIDENVSLKRDRN